MTPLLLASWKGLTEIVCLLIKHNADINATDNYGNTALMKSSRQNHINCVTELIEAGVDITIINNLGSTAYDMAKSPEMSRLLSIYPTDEVSRLQRESSYNRKNTIIVNPKKVSIDAIIKAENDVKVEELNLLINQLCENMSNENSKNIEQKVSLNTLSSTSNDNNSGSDSGSGSGSVYINSNSLNTNIVCTDISTIKKEENISYFADSGGNFPITLEPSRKFDSNILSGTFKIPWRSKPESVAIKIPKDDQNGLKDLLYEGSVFEKLGSEESTGCIKMFNRGPSYLVFESFYCDLETFTSSKFEIKVSIFQDVISAVKALHSFGIMHGDIKPKNILIKENLDCVKLCDLENARMENEHFRNDGSNLIFTPLWCAPEVFAGEANVLLANRKIDMFSVGLIGVSLLNRSRSGCKPILPTDPKEVAELFSSQTSLDAILPSEEIPTNFFEMIKSLCTIDIKNRISSSECFKMLGSTTRVYRENTELKKQNHLLEVGIKQKLDNISDEIGKIIPYMVGQFSVLKTLVTNINSRVVPTSFILLNKDLSGTSQVTSLYRALMHPGDVIQSKFRSLVMNKIYLYLLCEVCFEPQDDYGYPIEVHEPKKNVWKLLPLAQATLVTIKLLNVGLKIGRCFGFPTPVLHDSMLHEASSFLDAFDSKTLLPYQQLQQVVTSSLDLKAADNFTISELEILINREDPQQMWKRFLTKYTLPSGDFLYCCKNCYKKLGNDLVVEVPPPRPPRNSTPPPTLTTTTTTHDTTHDTTPVSTTPVCTADENVKYLSEDHAGIVTSSSSTSPRMRVKYSPADLARRKSVLANSPSSETVQLGAGTELILDNNKKAPTKKNSNNVKNVNNAPTVYDAINSPTSTIELENRKRGIFDCACS